jgi:RHH-type transcriptional regulator, proline utilization regulon repressor / proline dehydrogenase / delta 1-pyrroline-5-carboxylate dehydrogenase
MAFDLTEARGAIRPLHRTPEPQILAPLVAASTVEAAERKAIVERARGLLGALRDAQSDGWVNQFLQEYRLGTEEGTALLSLAEAFLRVPDPETADLLIADKLGDADWRAHKGQSASLLVNSATWGLVLGKAMVGDQASGALRNLVARAGEPFVRQGVGAAMRLMGQVFVMGRTIDEAMKRMEGREHKGFSASFDMLGEAARTKADAERYFEAYRDAIAAVGKKAERGHSISVKLSALHPRYETAKAADCVPELAAMLAELAQSAASKGVQLTVDAEEAARLEISLDIIEAVARAPELKGWDGFGMAIQAYSKRARPVIAWADALGRATERIMQVRLVKGAYWDSEIKWAQERGLEDYPLFTRKAATDVSYLACARDMLAARNIRPAFASHNALTVATILEWASNSRDFEFQRLHGMGQGLFEPLVREEGYHCRIYAPVGGHRDLLAYLVRRLLENGANSSFVHQLADEDVSEEELLADPVEKVMAVGGTRHPAIRLPSELFAPERMNSRGIDLDDAAQLAATADEVAKAVKTPAVDAASVDAAIGGAIEAFPTWSKTAVAERAACLNRLADLLEEHRGALMAIAVQEAKKTIPDALAEVREAIDFCRYYAARAVTDLQPVELPGPTGERNVLRMEGSGV